MEIAAVYNAFISAPELTVLAYILFIVLVLLVLYRIDNDESFSMCYPVTSCFIGTATGSCLGTLFIVIITELF